MSISIPLREWEPTQMSSHLPPVKEDEKIQVARGDGVEFPPPQPVSTRAPVVRHTCPNPKYMLPVLELFTSCKVMLPTKLADGHSELPYELECLFNSANPTLNMFHNKIPARFRAMGAFARAHVSQDEAYIFPLWPRGLMPTPKRPIFSKTGATCKNTTPLQRVFLYSLAKDRYDKYDDMRAISDIATLGFRLGGYHSGSVLSDHVPSTLVAGRDYLVFTHVKTKGLVITRKLAVIDTVRCPKCLGYDVQRPHGWRASSADVKLCKCNNGDCSNRTRVTNTMFSTVYYRAEDTLTCGVPDPSRIYADGDELIEPFSQVVRYTRFRKRCVQGTTKIKFRQFFDYNAVNIGESPSSWGWDQLNAVLSFFLDKGICPEKSEGVVLDRCINTYSVQFT